MTTGRQMNRFLRAIWGGKGSDFSVFDRTLCARPVRHFAGAIYFDRTSSKDNFRLLMSVQFLARSPRTELLGYGDRIHSPLYGGWDITRPDLIPELRAVAEAVVLPRLRAIETFDDFIAYANNPKFAPCLDNMVWERALIDAARGDFVTAQAGFERFMARGLPDDAQFVNYVTQTLFPPIAARDAAALAAVLHATEAANARRLGIADIWEPSPFPLETAILRS